MDQNTADLNKYMKQQEDYDMYFEAFQKEAKPYLRELTDLFKGYQKQVKGREALVSQCELDDISNSLTDYIETMYEELLECNECEWDFSDELKDMISKITNGEF